MRSVRARAALGATVVVAVALIGAGLAVLLVLRANLTDQAGLQAEVAAREVAGQLALDVPVDRLDLPDEEEHPVQVTDEDGRLVAVSKDLKAINGTGTDRVTPIRPSHRRAPAPTTTVTTTAAATATAARTAATTTRPGTSLPAAKSPPTTRTSPTAPPPSTATRPTTASPRSPRPPAPV